MAKIKKYINKIPVFTLALIFIILSICEKFPEIPRALDRRDNIRGCWISYLDIEEYLKDLSEDDYRIAVNNMLDRIKENNLNTIYLQVRSMADAIYPSSYFPWSTYISSDRENPGYDPLEIIIELAREKELRIEAWINPYRISLGTNTTDSYMNTSFYDQYKSFIMEYYNSNGEKCLSFDPSNTDTIRLIVSGIKEILNHYDVDGIHFDDYFYVPGMGDDLTREEKMKYVNNMVLTAYNTIKSIKPDCELGISPAGNIENAREQGADVDTWLREPGYIDYIMPQIYWTDYFSTSSGVTTLFSDRCSEWQEINILNIPMYLGMALYRVGEESKIDMGWGLYDDNLASQYTICDKYGFDGYCLFRYKWLEMDESAYEMENLNDAVNNEYLYPFVRDSYISYSVKNGGKWESGKIDGIRAGTGNSEINSIVITLGDKSKDGNVIYRVAGIDGVWSNWCIGGVPWNNIEPVNNIQIKLTGNIQMEYSIFYRCCFTNIGWLPWVSDSIDGNSGIINEKMPGIQIKIVKK